MIWAKRKDSVVQHICEDYASTLCNSKAIAEHVLPDWQFTNGERQFSDRRLCILCFGKIIREYDNTLLFRFVRKALGGNHLRAVG